MKSGKLWFKAAGLGTVLLIAAWLGLGYLSKMDRVDRILADDSQFDEAALSWIPFDRAVLRGAKNISLRTDVDTIQFIVTWEFIDSKHTSAWLINSETNQVLGTNQIPLPPHLK